MLQMCAKVTFLVTTASLLCACATVKSLPEDYGKPLPFPSEYLARFCYQPSAIQEELTLIKKKTSYNVYEASIDVGPDESGDESPITFEYYEQTADVESPVVLLLPILNGLKHLMRPFATHFAKNGYAVIIVDNVQRDTLLDDLKHPESAIHKTVQHHRRVLDWAESRPELDTDRIGVFGASLGAFNALFLAALDKRVKVASTALVGGSLPEVLVKSNERRIEEAVAGVKADLELSDEQLMDFLTDEIVTDTLTVAPHINADRLLMVMARFDKTIPYENQLRLYGAMGQPRAITLPTGHASAALYIFYLRSRVRKFFDRALAEPVGYGTAVSTDDPCSRGYTMQQSDAFPTSLIN